MSFKFESFLTGSKVYGTPHAESDVDLVILISESDAKTLWDNYDDTPYSGSTYGYGGTTKRTLRFGDLNIIALIDNEEGRQQYNIWKTVTEELKLRKPVTKAQAIAAFDKAGRTYINLERPI